MSWIFYKLLTHFLQVAIVLLAVVAAVAADSYSYKPAYKDEYAYVRNSCIEKLKPLGCLKLSVISSFTIT